jgi:hypothetical protein
MEGGRKIQFSLERKRMNKFDEMFPVFVCPSSDNDSIKMNEEVRMSRDVV